MVFTQAVTNPWARKTAVTREYREEFSKQKPGRQSFLAGLTNASLDRNGLRAVYNRDQHTGLSFVDLATVTREDTFRH
jgi:hypothetical protein